MVSHGQMPYLLLAIGYQRHSQAFQADISACPTRWWVMAVERSITWICNKLCSHAYLQHDGQQRPCKVNNCLHVYSRAGHKEDEDRF